MNDNKQGKIKTMNYEPLMNRINTSDLAFSLFKKGEYHIGIQEYFFKKDICGPEDLYIHLRKLINKELKKRYKDQEFETGEYEFNHNDLSLVELYKHIIAWLSEYNKEDKFSKCLREFSKDIAIKYIQESEEFERCNI